MAYHSSVGCDRRGDQPTGYATPSTCFHTPEITITRKRAHSQLSHANLGILCEAFFEPQKQNNISALVGLDAIKENLYNLSIPLYVEAQGNEEIHDTTHVIEEWKIDRVKTNRKANDFFKYLSELGYSVDGWVVKQ